MRFDHLAEVGAVELLAADVGEDNAATPREEQGALRPPAVDGQLRVALEQVDDFMGVLAGLFERVDLVLEARIGDEADALAVDGLYGFQPPVFDFEHQQATARVEDDKVRMHIARAERYVVPDQPVIFELLFKALGKAFLAAGHA